MASRGPDIGERLREGIEAARRGDRINARRLLQQVLILDRDNEAALMWMASVVDTLAERRAFLERAIKVNPNNQRAREALERLGGTVPPRAGGAVADTPAPAARRTGSRRGISPYIIAAAVVAIVTIVIVGVILLNNRQAPDTSVADAEGTLAAIIRPADATATPEPRQATATPFIGVIVTIDANAVFTLPATFTPTDTPQPTATFTATPTNVPPRTYDLFFSAYSSAGEFPGLYRSLGDGTRMQTLGNPVDGYSDVEFSPDGEWIVFVRVVSLGDAPPAPQIFLAPLANLAEAAPITNLSSPTLSSPSWAPDGRTLVFISGEDGDADVWTINRDGSGLRKITSNIYQETSPSYSPDGTRIIFASDMDSPGFPEIYVFDMTTNGTTRLTDEGGSNYAPAYSPDGSQIVFVSTQNGDSDLYVMDADGQRKFLVTIDDAGAEDRAPVYTPDGAYIAFISNRSGAFAPHLLNVRTGGITPITVSDQEVQSITINPAPFRRQ